jgi:hypothetical protein
VAPKYGRSGLLVGALIFSAIMLRDERFGKFIGSIGVAAGTLLFFTGDLGTAIFPASTIIAVLIRVGYLLWMIWLLLTGLRLLQLGYSRAPVPD